MPFFSSFRGDRSNTSSKRYCCSPMQQIVSYDFFDRFREDMDHITDVIKSVGLNEINLSDYEKFQVNVDVQHFAPSEISVKVVDGYVEIECGHPEISDEHGFISRHFVRKFPLPAGCLPDTVESKLTSDGILIVTAPKVLPMPSMGERIVPIVKTGPVKKQRRH